MKMGEETICYQHHQVETILEKLLKDYNLEKITPNLINDLKEAIDWIHTANESAVRMEDKLKWYKDNAKDSGMI